MGVIPWELLVPVSNNENNLIKSSISGTKKSKVWSPEILKNEDFRFKFPKKRRSNSNLNSNINSKSNLDDLSSRIDALAKALAAERREAQKFRDDFRALLRRSKII